MNERVMKEREIVRLERAVVRFAGDSGDGVQTIGDQLGLASAVAGNDIATLPDFPAEIRAPTGTVYGVSGFQLQFASQEISTAGDAPDVLFALNPAGLKRHLADLPHGAILIVDPEAFTERNLAMAGYQANPLEDGTLADWRLHVVPATRLTVEALKEIGVTGADARRCRNFFALGITCWLFSRPLDKLEVSLASRFRKNPQALQSAHTALRVGYEYGETSEAFSCRYEVPPARELPPGTYRSLSGYQAVAMGLVTAAEKAGIPCFFAGYPITPATDIMHALAELAPMGVATVQCEDEIAAAGAAIGGSYAGSLGCTATSGPGMALKSEMLGLAVATELPLVVVNVQRGGPSTGMPTKMEQADLLQAMHGRHGEAPLPVVAAASPSDAFDATLEAARIAIRHRTPVILLLDGNLAFGAEPWRIPDPAEIPAIAPAFRTDPEGFQPFSRDPVTGGRPWVKPGTPGMTHRIGGLERLDGSGHLSTDPANHEKMTRLRAEKVEKVADFYPPTRIDGPAEGELVVVSWGSTFGPCSTAVRRARDNGRSVSHLHLRHLNPLPKDLGACLRRFRRVLVPENNCGQLLSLLRAKYLIDAKGFSRVRGLPFRVAEIESAITAALEDQA